MQVTDHYKHFIKSCLQIDFYRRATPEFVIAYKWPMAEDYVDGVEPEGGNYKPMSIARMPSADYQMMGQGRAGTSTHIKDDSRD